MPDGGHGDKLSAKVSDGVLEITAPIAASAPQKKIQINAESRRQRLPNRSRREKLLSLLTYFLGEVASLRGLLDLYAFQLRRRPRG